MRPRAGTGIMTAAPSGKLYGPAFAFGAAYSFRLIQRLAHQHRAIIKPPEI
jgi:hypothetical protein